jgi:Transposase DDE domain group 1
LTGAARLCVALLDQFGTTVKPGRFETIDIDDTFCAAHGGQQLAFWNAREDERGFASMHIYHLASGTPVGAILRPARTPKRTEVRTVIKHVTQHWPHTRIVWRGDGHYGRVEAMEWIENHGDDYIFRPCRQYLDPARYPIYGGRSTGTSAVPQAADDFGAPRKSAEVGHQRTPAVHTR